MIKVSNTNWEFNFDLQYDRYIKFTKDNDIFYVDVEHNKIGIIGDIKRLALWFAIFMQGTLDVIDEGDVVFDAFIFSTSGKIMTYRWDNISNVNQVNDFINEYNRIYDTVELLK